MSASCSIRGHIQYIWYILYIVYRLYIEYIFYVLYLVHTTICVLIPVHVERVIRKAEEERRLANTAVSDEHELNEVVIRPHALARSVRHLVLPTPIKETREKKGGERGRKGKEREGKSRHIENKELSGAT